MSPLGVIPRPATLRALTGSDTAAISVHFNPASLQYTVTNTLKEGDQGNKKKQYITQSSGKLTMDLVFDTTGTGDDVRDTTKRIAGFMEPDKPKSAKSKKHTAKVVEFHWGVYTFKGMVESFKETIDFFSADGVPLRSLVNLTLVRQDEVFAPAAQGASGINRNPNLSPDNLDAVDVAGDPAGVAARAGDAGAARALGALNGAESLRFPAPGGLTLSGSIALNAPAGAASVSASASASLSTGLDIGGMLPSVEAAPSIQAGASFQLGGAAVNRTSSSLRADVGGSASLTAGLRFEES